MQGIVGAMLGMSLFLGSVILSGSQRGCFHCLFYFNSTFLMPYYSYVIRSLRNEILYKGSTQNIQNRLQYHNLGKVTFICLFSAILVYETMYLSRNLFY